MKYLAVLLLLMSSSTQAASILKLNSQLEDLPASAPLNVNINSVENIFGSLNFVDDIKINFNSAISYVDSRLSTIDDDNELSDLWYTSGFSTDYFDVDNPTSTSVVNMFIVDNINLNDAIGYGELLGNTMVLEESWLNSIYGANLFAHELGHNMGLDHSDELNIMYPYINKSTFFSHEEIKTINMNLAGLIQFDGNNRYIEVNPIFISSDSISSVAISPVPVPPAFLLFGSSLVGLMGYSKHVAKKKA